MNDRILHHYLEEFHSSSDVSPGKAETLFDAMISSDNQFLFAELITAWNEKGVSENELFECAAVMRGRMKRLNSRQSFWRYRRTGGCKSKTFNVTTAAAFVIAGASVPVAKHDNRAATSNADAARSSVRQL